MSFSDEYNALVTLLIVRGRKKPSRQVGSSTRSLTGMQIRAPVGTRIVNEDGSIEVRGFPYLACKSLALKQVFLELAWFLRGSTNANELHALGCKIWDDDAAKAKERGHNYPPGELGPVYGYQWRKRPDCDQLQNAIELLVSDPYSRRNLVVSWQCDSLKDMVLPPCHFAFQFVCQPRFHRDGREDLSSVDVDCVVTMRSTDVGLGLPFNMASYAMLTILVCIDAERLALRRPIGDLPLSYVPGEVVIIMSDCHIYESHVAALGAAVDACGGAGPDALCQCTVRLGADEGIEEFAQRDKMVSVYSLDGNLSPRVPLPLHT